MVLEFDRHHKRASPDLSIYIYSSISISTYIYICVYLLFAWKLQWPTLRTSLFPWSICLYLSSIYLYTCVYLLFAWNQLQWPTLRTSLFWAFISLSLSNTYPWNGLSNNKTLNLAKWPFLVDGVGIWPTYDLSHAFSPMHIKAWITDWFETCFSQQAIFLQF